MSEAEEDSTTIWSSRPRTSMTTGGFIPSDVLTNELKAFVKSRLAPYKYPRWIEYVADLPKTATGKIQRFKLRAASKPVI